MTTMFMPRRMHFVYSAKRFFHVSEFPPDARPRQALTFRLVNLSCSANPPDRVTSPRNCQISGAMDKFTAVGGGGVAAKRTKTVLKSRTYMEGGYMKTVREEVEVTDDEEVRACMFFVFVFFSLSPKKKQQKLKPFGGGATVYV